MIQITFNFTDIAAASALFAKLNGNELGAIAPTPAPGLALDSGEFIPAAELNKPAAAEAPGKPAKSARSKPTAEAAVAAAPAPSTPPPAVETPTAAPAAATSVAYPDLQKAVLTLHKMDPTAAVPIAKGLGADTFKLLPESAWAEALRQVNEAIAARG